MKVEEFATHSWGWFLGPEMKVPEVAGPDGMFYRVSFSKAEEELCQDFIHWMKANIPHAGIHDYQGKWSFYKVFFIYCDTKDESMLMRLSWSLHEQPKSKSKS